MTVDITQEEMNILNLNGISEADIRGNIEFQRASGLDDKAIRQHFTNTINELKPMTRQTATDTAKIQEWKNKGAITPFEAAQRSTVEFDGTYNNVIKKEPQPIEMNAMGKAVTSFFNKVTQPIKNVTPDFIKDGLKQVGDTLNQMGKDSYEAQLRYAEQQANMQMPHKGDPNYRYTPVGTDVTGRVIYKETDLTKKIDFAESASNSMTSGEWIPFAGGFIKGADDKKQREIQEKIIKNEPIREDELNYLNYRLNRQQEEQVRGFTIGGQIGESFLPSLVRFGSEMVVGGWILKGLGLTAELGTGASLGQKITHGISEMGKTGLVNTITPIGWNDIYENYQGRMLNNEMTLTPKGKWIFQNSEEKPATSFMKSLGETFIMFASEASGELLHIPVKGATAAATKYVGTPLSKYLMSNKTLADFVKKATPEFSKLYEKMNGLPITGRNLDWLKSKVKFDGFFEELGEEVVEDVLNLTAGTRNEERSLENYANAIFKSPDEWAVLAGAIALQGGTLSVASHILGSHLERNGATDEQILEVMNNLSETDKEQMVENLIQDGVLNIDETDEEHFEKSVKSVANNLIQSGQFKNREKAEQAARLGATMLQNLSEKTGISADDLIRDEMAEISVTDEDIYTDENGVLHTGIQHNENPAISIDNQIDEWSKELLELPDDFEDEEYINNLVSKISLLQAIKDNELTIDDMERANDLIAEYEENGESKFATQLREYINNPNNYNVPITQRSLNQSADLAGATPAEYKDAAKEWKEKGTESKYFKSWFGNSKVSYFNGEPIVVYHGTENNFRIFKNLGQSRQIGANIGFFFTSSDNMANQYANDSRVMPVYLSLQNPLIVEPNTTITLGDKEIEITDTFDLFTQLDRIQSEQETREELINQGYDGIILNSTNVDTRSREDIHDVYVAFYPEQIKSVNNRGTFNSNNPNIYFQKQTPNNLVDWTDKFDKVPTFEEIEKHIKDIIASGEIFDTLSPEWKIDIKGGNRVVDKITNAGNFQNLKNSPKKRHNKYVKGIKELINNAVYSHEDNNTKPKEKPNVLKYHYFNVNVKIGEKIYQVNLECEETKNAPKGGYAKRSKNSSRSNKNVNQTNDNVKTVHLYNIKEVKSDKVYFQKANRENLNQNIENNFEDSAENITSYLKDDVLNILADNGIEESEFSFEDIRIYGSYSTSTNKSTSDLDVMVQYSGSMREDDAFNLFADEDLYITDKNGRRVRVDINPVNSEISGTIDENLEYFDSIDDRLERRKTTVSNGQLNLFSEALQLNLFQEETIFKQEHESGQNVQENIKEEYTQKDIKENTNIISDVGDSLLGNLKKNKKQYTWQELADMNELLRKKYVAKSYIYQLESYDELKSKGLSDKAIAFIQNVYSKINSKPAKGYDSLQNQELYYNFVNEIMQKTVEYATQNNKVIDEHIAGTNNDLFKIVFPDTENKKPYNIFRAYPEYNKKAIVVGGNKLIGALYLDYQTEKSIKQIMSTFNKKEEANTKEKTNLDGWRKYFEIGKTYSGWFVADRKSGKAISSKDIQSQEEAEKLAEKLYKYLNQNIEKDVVDFSKLRNYIPRRKNNQNVNPEALIEVFGFRGVNFGNWTKQSERQDFVNLAYDSLYDLAEILNLPPKALSLGGKLGLAFGAQGRRGAAGHFIPEYNEINLTRKQGAGTLAHEWWHALDYYFGDQAQNKEFGGKAVLSLTQQGGLRKEIFDAINALNDNITYSPITEEEIAEKKDEYRKSITRKIEYWAKDIKSTFAKSKNADKINAYIDDIVQNAETINASAKQDALSKEFIELLEERRRTFDNLNKPYALLYQVKRLQQIDELARSSKKYSEYYRKATRIDANEKGNGYWTKKTELGARAFASYILDKMNQKEMQNKFLVRDPDLEFSYDLEVVAEVINAHLNDKESNKTMKDAILEWYPAETEERKRIFESFDKLFQEVKTREENKNIILYQKQKTQRAKQRKLLIDNDKSEEITNRLEKIKGSFIPAENLIRLFKDADESTIVHEFAHWWLEKLQKYAEDNEEIQQDLAEIRKFVKNNGEAFTDEQHERFARGFEAYMRTGSAKTNRLKKLFEDFKNALLSLYDSIKSLGFNEEEIPEINNLFDRLLTTENERVQAAVFNRVNEIQTQIETIKEKQNSELSDIDEIYNNNIERDAQDAKRKAQVQEYLRLADKATDRVPKSVQEYSKRYRQACYEILHAALNGKYSIKYIQMTLGQNNKKAEQLREELLEVDDGITVSGGMRANWYEFFADTGVNYDTEEIDGDYKLVEQALNAIESGSFLPPEQYEGEQVIGKFFGMFDYLAGKVMSLRGENKDAAYEALTSIFDKIPAMPDGAMEDIAVKLEEISNTFVEQKTRENISGRMPAISNVTLAVQLRTYVTNKLHEMKSYDPVEKRYVRLSSVNRLYSLLKYATDTTSTKEIIRQINAHAIAQLENRQKSILHKEIQKQIKTNSKLIKVGALKQGKFDWKTNTVFSELADMNRLSLEDAQKEYLRLTHADEVELGESRDSYDENPTATLNAPTDFQKILKVKFLEYKSNKVKNLNVTATRSLLEDILELKFEGRRAKNEQDLQKALSRYNYENNLIQIIDKNKFNEKAKFVARWVAGDTAFTSEGTLANWESLLNAIFDNKTAKEYSLLKLESDAEVYAHRKLKEFYNKAIEIYRLRRGANSNINKVKNMIDKFIDFEDIQPLVNLLQQYEDEVYTYQQDTWNKDTNKVVSTSVELTHSQIITLYTWSLNPELKKRLIVQFGGDETVEGSSKSKGEMVLEDMFSKLSDEDKQFAWLLVDTCDSMYEDTNEVFIRTTGLSLQRVDNYFPSKTERVGSDIDMLHEFIVRSTNPSFIKSRKNCSRIKMDPQSPLEILLPHVNKTARYVVLSERVNFLNRIFASNDIQAKLVEIYGKKSGKKLHQVLLNQLATSTYANYAKSVTVGKTLMDKVASNYITSRIGGNLKVMFSQLTSVINYTENMPADVWAKGFADAIKHPKETIKYMFDNCEYLNTRLASGSMNEVMAKLTDESDKLRSLRNFCSTNTKYGDILAICFGGKPYVDYLIDSGMTKGQAFEKFVEDTLRSQQSGHNSATSAWQKKQAETPFTRMIFAFNNTNLQYERKWVDAISNYVKGDTTKKEFARAFLIYKVFNPILFTSFLTNLSIFSLFRGLLGGDDDELFGFGKDVSFAVLLSNLKGYGMLGILANALGSIVYAAINKDRYLSQDLPLVTDLEETAQKLLTKDDLSFEDYIKMTSSVGDYTTGVPFTRLVNVFGGVGDMAQGDFGVGALRMIGYGKYKANVAAKGEPPKKKK